MPVALEWQDQIVANTHQLPDGTWRSSAHGSFGGHCPEVTACIDTSTAPLLSIKHNGCSTEVRTVNTFVETVVTPTSASVVYKCKGKCKSGERERSRSRQLQERPRATGKGKSDGQGRRKEQTGNGRTGKSDGQGQRARADVQTPAENRKEQTSNACELCRGRKPF